MKTVDVASCARCGKDHPQLEFRAFASPPPQYGFWAPCPTNGEPVLLREREVGESVPDAVVGKPS